MSKFSRVRPHLPQMFHALLLLGVVAVSCHYSDKHARIKAEAFGGLADRVSELNAKVDAMVEAGGGKFVPKPIRPEREGS